MALAGLRVVELEGIGGGPLTACILADFGAEVITVSRVTAGKLYHQGDPVSRGKKSIGLDLKSKDGMDAMHALIKSADILIDPFRPGAMEKIGLGPKDVEVVNPRMIYSRLTGWGQGGDPKIEKSAGHDANYLALSGALDLWRSNQIGHQERPLPPANYAGDYAGGGLMCAIGILLAVHERRKSGKGQTVDAAMLDGAAYIAWPSLKGNIQSRGGGRKKTVEGDTIPDHNVFSLASHYHNIYECKEDSRRPGRKEYISIQAMEPAFYRDFLKGIGLDKDTTLPKQSDQEAWPMMFKKCQAIILSKTRDEWAEIYRGTDACMSPVLNAEEAAQHPHNKGRGTFGPSASSPGKFEPNPAPHLSRTPGHQPRPDPIPGADTRNILKSLGLADTKIADMFKAGVTADESAERGVFERNQPSKL